jgi:hypothetical protein
MKTKYKLPIIILSIIAILFVADKFINPFDGYVSKNEEHISDIEQADSVINVASEQIDKVQLQNAQVYNKLDSLGSTVKLNELTIEEQVIELSKLLKLANKAKQEALDQRELAIKFQEQAEIARMQSKESQKLAEYHYSILLSENKELKEEIEKLKKKVTSNKFSDIKSDTTSIEDLDINPIFDEKKNKKKKKN